MADKVGVRRSGARATFISCLVIGLLCSLADSSAEGFRIASYNLRNYLAMDRQVEGVFRRDYPKPELEKAALRESIRAARPDLLVVQEIGGLAFLEELKRDLASEGLPYRGAFVVEAEDEVRMIGALWTDALDVEAIAHSDMEFSNLGETAGVKRGMLELTVDLGGTRGSISVFALHLKSRYTTDPRDPKAQRQRTGEAQAARDRILSLFPDPSESAFLVVGDLNDYRNSSAVGRLLSRGETTISEVIELKDEHGLEWTHYYQKGGEYSLIDYMLGSPKLLKSYRLSGGVLNRDDAYLASDHRLVWLDVGFGDN